jgi:hypothetical protein
MGYYNERGCLPICLRWLERTGLKALAANRIETACDN